MQPDALTDLLTRREILRFEAARLDRLLTINAKQAADDESSQNPVLALLDHHSVTEQTECACTLCLEWTSRRSDLKRILNFQPQGHRWSICDCRDCQIIRDMHTNYMAATNKRDLFIELSFYATHHTKKPEAVMTWFNQEFKKPNYSAKWCAHKINQIPMSFWLQKCENALSGMFSGRVFPELELEPV
jgi:hypothetical protein